MGIEHNSDTRWRAQELYCVDRLTFMQIAEIVNVADSTLRRWADTWQWRERREEIAQAESEIRADTVKARASILKRLLQAEDGKTASQVAFAVASLENLALQQQKALLAGEISNPARPEKTVQVSTRAEAVTVLWQAVNDKLNTVLSDKKYVTTESVGEIMKCLELVRDMEATLPNAASEEKSRTLSLENTKALQEIIGG